MTSKDGRQELKEPMGSPISSEGKNAAEFDTNSLLSFRRTKLAHQLFDRTIGHPNWANLIAWAPTIWLESLSNPQPLEDTTTGGADGLPDRRVNLESLYANLLEYGMRDPFILSIGINGRSRLETGNQRIRCILAHDVPFVPVIGYVHETAIISVENGKHEGLLLPINSVALMTSYHCYIQPIDILLDTPLLSA